ncbi:MAG: NAD(P)/FAD-dependent oxidoreductase [Alphaproteobacteria bacterium]|nr:NAD(P)/FAD-dependent oxidoreductase [Alphaproteobacteria bacterium]
MTQQSYDVAIIGAGAAGLFCAAEAGKRGRRVLLLDHAKKLAEKIRISGGGRCNFTNIHTRPDKFLSQNPHFCKSALAQFTAADFVERVKKRGIPFHEKKLGQLFCDNAAQDIIDMLLDDCADAGVTLHTETTVNKIEHTEGRYTLLTSGQTYDAASLVIATGGLSIPKIGATGFGYDVARQFGLNIIPTRAGLVPLTFGGDILTQCKALSGVSVEADVKYGKTSFAEGLLFTHRGLSGPSILQISSYWQEGTPITVDLARGVNTLEKLKTLKHEQPRLHIHNAAALAIPQRLADSICEELGVQGRLADLTDKALATIAARINNWNVLPAGSEGYRTAEVTLGGVDTAALSSKTMECKNQPGLYFIGEVVDVTGHLGGYNFQWAWSSGYAAGQSV